MAEEQNWNLDNELFKMMSHENNNLSDYKVVHHKKILKNYQKTIENKKLERNEVIFLQCYNFIFYNNQIKKLMDKLLSINLEQDKLRANGGSSSDVKYTTLENVKVHINVDLYFYRKLLQNFGFATFANKIGGLDAVGLIARSAATNGYTFGNQNFTLDPTLYATLKIHAVTDNETQNIKDGETATDTKKNAYIYERSFGGSTRLPEIVLFTSDQNFGGNGVPRDVHNLTKEFSTGSSNNMYTYGGHAVMENVAGRANIPFATFKQGQNCGLNTVKINNFDTSASSASIAKKEYIFDNPVKIPRSINNSKFIPNGVNSRRNLRFSDNSKNSSENIFDHLNNIANSFVTPKNSTSKISSINVSNNSMNLPPKISDSNNFPLSTFGTPPSLSSSDNSINIYKTYLNNLNDITNSLTNAEASKNSTCDMYPFDNSINQTLRISNNTANSVVPFGLDFLSVAPSLPTSYSPTTGSTRDRFVYDSSIVRTQRILFDLNKIANRYITTPPSTIGLSNIHDTSTNAPKTIFSANNLSNTSVSFAVPSLPSISSIPLSSFSASSHSPAPAISASHSNNMHVQDSSLHVPPSSSNSNKVSNTFTSSASSLCVTSSSPSASSSHVFSVSGSSNVYVADSRINDSQSILNSNNASNNVISSHSNEMFVIDNAISNYHQSFLNTNKVSNNVTARASFSPYVSFGSDLNEMPVTDNLINESQSILNSNNNSENFIPSNTPYSSGTSISAPAPSTSCSSNNSLVNVSQSNCSSNNLNNITSAHSTSILPSRSTTSRTNKRFYNSATNVPQTISNHLNNIANSFIPPAVYVPYSRSISSSSFRNNMHSFNVPQGINNNLNNISNRFVPPLHLARNSSYMHFYINYANFYQNILNNDIANRLAASASGRRNRQFCDNSIYVANNNGSRSSSSASSTRNRHYTRAYNNRSHARNTSGRSNIPFNIYHNYGYYGRTIQIGVYPYVRIPGCNTPYFIYNNDITYGMNRHSYQRYRQNVMLAWTQSHYNASQNVYAYNMSNWQANFLQRPPMTPQQFAYYDLHGINPQLLYNWHFG
ncbi:putative uncharacterized protein DDB_G0282133 [Teleopsis dalmanni]|uniref:putative uncharacterized protein DDB_G0282133 n=1 Tax=Teleopsis dalmanni TaxID=139649 RepID=UPI0018CFDA74|nr:putative uncharacterized protein DDB_G0282133 [Teleopsis dalmanni]